MQNDHLTHFAPQICDFLDRAGQLYLMQLDQKGNVVFLNQYAQQISGADIVGQRIADVIVSFSGPFDLDDFCARSQQRQPLTVPSQAGLPLTFYFSVVKNDHDTLLIGEASGEDVAVLRRNLIEMNNELNNLSRKYQKANAELSKLNQQKNHFLGVAAHDLRNPLAAILGYCDFLIEDLPPDSIDQINFVEVIKTSSQYMLRLLEDLLDIAKIEAGKLQLQFQPVDFVELIRKNVEINRILAQKKGIALRFNCHETLPLVELDVLKIEQVINNLLSNAIKFSQSNTAVDVELFLAGSYATVVVRDRGIGIPPHALDTIFLPFTHLTASGTAGETSTGLGLAIVQKIITGHQGRIWVESVEGAGTTFYFTVPVSR